LSEQLGESKSYFLTEKPCYEKNPLIVSQRKCTEYACYSLCIPDSRIRNTGIETSINTFAVVGTKLDLTIARGLCILYFYKITRSAGNETFSGKRVLQ